MKTHKTIYLILSISLIIIYFVSPIKLFSQSLRDAGKIKSFQYAVFYSDVAEEYKKYLPDIEHVKYMSKYYMPKVTINNSGKSSGAFFENGYMFIYLSFYEAIINNQILYYGGISIEVSILSDAWDKIYAIHQYVLTSDLTSKEFNTDCSKIIGELIKDFSVEYYKNK